MKKYILASVIMVTCLVLVFVALSDKQTANAIGPIIRSGANVASMNSAGIVASNATTTAMILRNQVGVATSTMTFPSDNLDAIALNMRVMATSTSNVSFKSYLQMNFQSSDDNIDWFDYDFTVINPAASTAASSTVGLASTTVPLTYRPSTVGATTTKAFTVPLIPARFTRIVFTVGTTTAVTVQDEIDIWVNAIGVLSSTIR